MPERSTIAVRLRQWEPDDFALLERLLGDPEMTRYIGGPESVRKLASRHQRYLDFDEPGGTFAIVRERDGESLGWVGYWESAWDGTELWEVGWSVLPEFQGRGVATAATGLVIVRARAEGRFRFADAYPSIENAPSNRVCEKLGFTCLGEVAVEYPPGSTMRSNHWRLDLEAPATLADTAVAEGVR